MRSKLAAALSFPALMIALSPVGAADLGRRPVLKAAPASVAAFDWTGPYLGVYAGVAATRSRSLDPDGAPPGVIEHTGAGFTGGGTAGYNWQLNFGIFGNKFLVGLEGDIGYFDTSRRAVDWADQNLTYDSKTSWLGTARGRVGLTDGPNLSYVTAGYAAVGVKDINVHTANGTEVSSSKTRGGYVIGSGTETMLGGGWTAKTEYLYVNAGKGDTLTNAANGFSLQTDQHRYYTQRFGVNYLFGAGKSGPLPQNNWNGFYAGVVGGGALASVRGTGLDGTAANAGEIGNNGSGFSAGGQAGWNWMIGPRVVVGVEGDISYLGIDHSSSNFNNLNAVYGLDTSWIGTVRGRLAYNTGPALLYATAGGAWVNVKESLGAAAGTASASKTLSGWTVGGGIETVLWGNWSTKTEYLLVDVGNGSQLTGVGSGFVLTADHQYHLFRSALVYRFAGGKL
jgi:outer membrane immunogenic protein